MRLKYTELHHMQEKKTPRHPMEILGAMQERITFSIKGELDPFMALRRLDDLCNELEVSYAYHFSGKPLGQENPEAAAAMEAIRQHLTTMGDES